MYELYHTGEVPILNVAKSTLRESLGGLCKLIRNPVIFPATSVETTKSP